jgi:hypothetical protein
MSRITKTQPGPPHEVNVARLVEKLVDVGAFVGYHCYPELLILKGYAPVPTISKLGYATSIISVVLIGLVVHLNPSPELEGERDSTPAFGDGNSFPAPATSDR